MLNFFPATSPTCEGVSRRSLMQLGTLAGLGISLPSVLPRTASAGNSKSRHASIESDTNCILIWTQGGTSHHDTFDPKPQAPVSVKGEFGVISTAIPGVQFTEILPRMAREAGRFGLLRSWNPMNASHGIADQHVLSGRAFNPAVPYPTIGSVISQEMGFKTAMPPFVQLGNALDHRFGGGTSGILGLEHNPFEILADPNAASFVVRDIKIIDGPNGVFVAMRDRGEITSEEYEATKARVIAKVKGKGLTGKREQ